jgi:hypothetical protein
MPLKMKLIRERVEDVNYLTEATEDGKKDLYIQGPFLVAEQGNKNRRMYKIDTLQREVDRYVKEYVDTKRALGELGHPDTPSINLERVSHLITELKQDGNIFVGKAKILDTPYGNIVKNFIESGVNLGVSSRGMGSLVPGDNGLSVVQDDFRLATAADIVADPSAPGAFVNGIMEGKEWLFVEGRYVEVDIDNAKRQIKKASSKQLEEVAIKLFDNFISKL